MADLHLDALRHEVELTSQNKAAKRIGYSSSVVSQVLAGTYNGDMKAVRKAIEGALMAGTVECPVLGKIPSNRCMTTQRQKLQATTPERVRLWKACRNGCPNSRLTKTEIEESDDVV